MKQTSRKAARKLKRQEAKERRERDRKRRERLRRLKKAAFYGIAVFAVAVFAYWVYGRFTEQRTWTSVPIMRKYHLASGEPFPVYNSDPPTSGPHTSDLARWGVHRRPILKERQVHNLEDGGVLVQYNCPEGCPDLVAKLEAIVKGFNLAILAPYPGMEKRIALTAWGRLYTSDDFEEDRIVSFIKAHIGIDHH